MTKLINLAGYKIIENKTIKTKTYIILWFGKEQKKVKTLEEAIKFIYESEMRYIENNCYMEVTSNDKTN